MPDRRILRFCSSILLAIAPTIPSHAHSWYPPECCSDRDCMRLTPDEVRETDTHFLIAPTGLSIPRTDPAVRDSRDGDYHICIQSDGSVPCFYVPVRSS